MSSTVARGISCSSTLLLVLFVILVCLLVVQSQTTNTTNSGCSSPKKDSYCTATDAKGSVVCRLHDICSLQVLMAGKTNTTHL